MIKINLANYGGFIEDNIPAVVAYNLVHYESLHPVNNEYIQKTGNLVESYIAVPSRYEQGWKL